MSEKKKNLKNKPMLVVVMGVSGTGKTTLAIEISKLFKMEFLDGDSLHSESAIKQMSQGIALKDEQREPWVQRIGNQLKQLESQGKSCVLAYSGLKKRHRTAIFSTYTEAVGILLNVNKSLLLQRLKARDGHFMPPELLNSQIASMEPFTEEITLIKLNPANKIEELLLQSASFISSHLHSTDVTESNLNGDY